MTSKSPERPRTSRMTKMASLAAAALSVTAVSAQAAGADTSGRGVEIVEGKLADGTPYLVRKPSNWNGIVVTDLDGKFRGNDGFYQMLLNAGYGTVGANRRPWDRAWTLNRGDDVRRPQEALEIFKAKFGKPKFVIAFGGSAGGAVALLTAEHRPDTVDGAVATCATMPFGYAHYNVIFEFFYTLKALLAPHDDKLLTHALPPRDYRPIMDHWRSVVRAAAKTPEGRARIALAFAIAQYPVYGSKATIPGLSKPDLDDPDAVMAAMVKLLPDVVDRLVHLTVFTEKDFPPDLQIRGTPQPNVVGNDGAIYADYWKNSDPLHKRVAQAMYARAGLDLAADLRTIDAAPRVKLDRTQLGAQGLIGRGLPSMPVFRMDNLGDLSAPPITSTLYDALIAANGLDDLYRTSYVDNSGHCFFAPEHEFAAVEVMRERLETGKWPATDPAALNARIGYTDRWILDGKPFVYDRGMRFVERNFGSYTGTWRLMEYPDAYRPATFASAATLVKSYGNSVVTAAQRRDMLAHLTAAERMAKARQADAAKREIDRFVGVAEGVSLRTARTRLLATAHQLRTAD